MPDRPTSESTLMKRMLADKNAIMVIYKKVPMIWNILQIHKNPTKTLTSMICYVVNKNHLAFALFGTINDISKIYIVAASRPNLKNKNILNLKPFSFFVITWPFLPFEKHWGVLPQLRKVKLVLYSKCLKLSLS